MKHRSRYIWLAIIVGILLFIALQWDNFQKNAQRDFVSIGTAGITGVYYPTGAAICRLAEHEASKAQFSLLCSPEATGGSIFNLNAIAGKDLSLGIVQSDWQYHSYHGTSIFEGRANPNLRAVFSMQTEPFTVVARADSNINTFDDLLGKRVNIGDPGSGQRANMEALMEVYEWTTNDFQFASELKASEHSEALCDNRIDAFLYTVGHPNASIVEAATRCDIKLIPVNVNPPSLAFKLIEGRPYYVQTAVPGGMYRDNPNPTPTFGLKATLVTHADVPDDVVYFMVKSVFENLEVFKAVRSSFADLTVESMLDGNSAPFHPGALRYYQEQGWL